MKRKAETRKQRIERIAKTIRSLNLRVKPAATFKFNPHLKPQ